MTVPIVSSVARRYPDVRFTVLSRPFARPFFEGLAPNVFFMGADVKGEYRGIRGLNKLYRRLEAKNFTAIADLHNVLRSKYLRMRFFLGFADNCKISHLVKHRGARRRLCAYNNKVRVQLPTSFDGYRAVFARLGYPVEPQFTSLLPPGGAELRLLPPAFAAPKNDGERWIGIAPFAAHKWKVYPLNRMEEVVRILTTRHPKARIFFFGGGDDEMRWFADMSQRYPSCTVASGSLGGIRGELVLMSHLDVMLSMDSANMHMAAIAGCRVVSVWGATHPFAGFAPWGQSPDDIVQTDLPCRPCSVYGNKECRRGDFACMYGIKPSTIVERLEKYL